MLAPRVGMPVVGPPAFACYYQPMADETPGAQASAAAAKRLPKLAPVSSTVIHRVCIQCNNMFRVTPDKFDAKQCPTCHKG